MRAQSGMLKGLNPKVTVASLVGVILFVLFCAVQDEQAAKAFETASGFILYNFKWYYITLISAVLGVLAYIAVSRFGNLKLGADEDVPEFSFASWIAMLFSAGMGIGLIFWSVAEPMLHYADNPFSKGLTDESASIAMRITLFHWGLHPWAIFSMIGLGLAYFAYRRGLPLALRSLLYPLIGNRIYGWIGHVVDIMGVVITAFGVSQSLGLGVAQINTGLHQVFDVPVSIGLQLSIILVVSILACVSLLVGLSKGMKRISTLNMYLSFLLMLAVLLLGPTRYILNLMFESTGDYVQNIVGLSFWMDAQKDSEWQNWWTAFYWPWWMTWGPFVGLFIARISKGRTIRELVVGALIVPTMVTILWMSVFGGASLKQEQLDRQAYQQSVAAQEVVQEQAVGDQKRNHGGHVHPVASARWPCGRCGTVDPGLRVARGALCHHRRCRDPGVVYLVRLGQHQSTEVDQGALVPVGRRHCGGVVIGRRIESDSNGEYCRRVADRHVAVGHLLQPDPQLAPGDAGRGLPYPGTAAEIGAGRCVGRTT
jgi:choline/carnitine/betaine transport